MTESGEREPKKTELGWLLVVKPFKIAYDSASGRGSSTAESGDTLIETVTGWSVWLLVVKPFKIAYDSASGRGSSTAESGDTLIETVTGWSVWLLVVKPCKTNA